LYPVSQLANIGEEKTYETNFRQNILINALFSFSSPVSHGYPQQRLRYTQNSNYFPIVQCQIHILGSKKKHLFFLASFGDHQYGLSGEIRNNTIHKIGIECSVLGLLRKKGKCDKFKECPSDAGLNRIGHLVFKRPFL
jgi:hypothetical protein